MTVKELADRLGCRVAAGETSLERPVTGGYAGDLLSWVMAHASAGSAWVTVMGNVNVVAVAVLTDVACVILAEGVQPDEQVLRRAGERDVALLLSTETSFSLAAGISRALAP